MNDEIAKVRLEIDGKDAQTAFESLSVEAKEINKQLKDMKAAGEQGSEGWQELKNRQREVNQELKEFKHNIDINDASLNELNAALSYWTKEANKAKVGTEEWIEATEKVGEIKNRVSDVKDEMNELGGVVDKHGKEGGWWSNMKGQVLAVFTGTGLLDLAKSAGAAILEFGMDVFTTTAKFEKYEAVLGNALGTQEKAAKAMDDIKKFASETPFSVDELTESYVKYVNRGLQPSMAEMTKLGDIAASQGKSFEQLTEAVLDAGTGEFERLKEFGIQASKSGDQVSLSFKGVQQTVANTPEAIQGALLAFGELGGVAGGMAVISQTLEGRVSNLGDNFDALKLTIGEALMPVFTFLLDLFSAGITKATELFHWFGSLGENSTFLGAVWQAVSDIGRTIFNVFGSILSTLTEVIGTVFDLIDGWIGLSGQGNILTGILNLVSGALKIVGSIAIAAIGGLQMLADGLNILMNKGKEVANFFGADFKIDPKANFDTLSKNANDNFSKIENLWKTTSSATVKTADETNKKVTDSHTKSQETQTATQKKEAEKQKKEADKLAADKTKAEADMLKKIEDMQVKSIADDTKRKIAQANLDYKREQDTINKSLASEATKAKSLQVLEKNHQAALTKINDDARTKKLKADDDTRKKQEAADKKTADDQKKAREDKLKGEKQILDAGFKNEIERAKLDLSLTKDNSKAQWDAKKALLDAEMAFKKNKLAQEAAAEKARITESVADATQKAAAIKTIDDTLSAQITANETKLQADKVKLQTQANEARQKNNEEFFKALDVAMKGDLTSFVAFLQKKTVGDQKMNNERLQNFAKKSEEIGEVAIMAVKALQTLNENYTKKQIANLTAEKKANFKKLDDEFAKGKITKEALDSEKDRLNKEFDGKETELKKKAFERDKKLQIAMALISGAMAFIKALASGFFPLNLVFAGLTAVATGIQIGMIKKQQFSGAKGGTFRNAGVARGSAHGAKYGDAGIAMYDRLTGAEVGEIEGNEPVMVLSQNTYRNNGPIIDRLLHSSLHKNGAPITMRNGGAFSVSETGALTRRMLEDGGIVDTEDSGSGASNGVRDDGSGSGQTNAMIEKNSKIAENTEKNTKVSADSSEDILKELKSHTGLLTAIKNKPDASSEILHSIDRLRDNISKSNAK